MRIATKLNAGIFVVCAASVLANYAVLQSTIKPQFDEIEANSALVNHKRVKDAFDTIGTKLRDSSQDWGFWTDAYNFAKGVDAEKFIESNLISPVDTVTGLGVNAIAFRSADGTAIWSHAFSLEDKSPLDALANEMAELDFRHPLLDGKGEAAASFGLVRTSMGLAVVAVAPILTTGRTGSPSGTVVISTLLDEGAVRTLTGVDYSLEPIPASGTNLTAITTSKVLDSEVATLSLISDIKGQPLVVLHAKTPRDVTKAGAAAIHSATLHMLESAAAVILALWLFVRMIVVSRIEALMAHFSTAAASGRLCGVPKEKSNDEIGKLAKSFNDMAEQVNNLRDALADKSYLSGMSEWAAGTLHNVRNGLSPINLNALKVQDLLKAAVFKNVKSAVQQLESTNTPADRREKLNAYILTSAPLMVDCAEKTVSMAGDIMSASKAVEDIVAEYEMFSRSENVLEEIDLRPLIESVAKTAIESHDQPVRLSLPPESAIIAGNRTILRQVLSNLFINALEAMDGQDHQPEIRVQLQSAGDAKGSLKLLMSDNGEGIAPGHLKSIFERGFSKREYKNGGLGLHWCANATQSMGGSLHAESNGPGAGSTLVLTLPTSNSELKDAA